MRWVRAVGAVALLAAGVAPSAVAVPTPSAGALSPATPSVTWTGSFVIPNIISPGGCDPSFCDRFALTVDLVGGTGDLEIVVTQPGALTAPGVALVDAATGEELDDGGGLGQATITYDDVAAGDYLVEVTNGDILPGAGYSATATLTPGPPPVDPSTVPADTVAFDGPDADAPVASATVPLRVVLVGFDEGSMTEEQVFSQIPDFQRVGSLYSYDGGLRSGDDGLPNVTLLNHGRVYYDQETPFLLPVEYRWDPELHYAPTEFTQGLFQHMVEASATGEFADPLRRVYLEGYNLTRGILGRLLGGDASRIVAPLNPVRFVDGESTEDWIAANAEPMLGFPAGREPGQAGYTVFVLNTWDSPEALDAFPADEYHVFRIDRTDPDRGDFDGIDWARIWGGRYRFMMVDLGAAPNGYESETWANRAKSVLGSALFDPPLWEMRAGLPYPVDFTELLQGLDGLAGALDPTNTLGDDDLVVQISRVVNEAVNNRFFHSYLYEPRPGTGRFYLSDNIWHDRLAIYRSDLTKLYDQEAALNGLRTLTPYFEFDGDVQYEYLEQVAAHPEYAADQAALDQAKADGDDIVGVPHLSLHTNTMMDYIDSDPARFLRGGACATTIPTIQVVVPGHYAWALPIAAGIATNRNGVPWGFLNSVNDVTKWNGADKDQTLVLAHPNILYSSTFTYTTIHEASHYLGLAHPHDTVGATRNADGTPRYYDGFTWAFNTTAAPTTYSHVETTYSILDQESIARGHLSFYLQWTFEALEDAGAAAIAAGRPTLGSLTTTEVADRALAIQRAGEAQQHFADFEFVRATFAAQEAWRAAAAYRDSVLGLEAGSSQVERGTQHGTDAELAAAGCPVAQSASAPIPSFDPGVAPTAGEVGGSDGHAHSGGDVAAGGSGGTLPATGGGPGMPLAPLAVAVAAVLLAVRRLALRR
jgi:hypothetical protein